MKKLTWISLLAIVVLAATCRSAQAQVSVGVGRPGIYVNTPNFSFQYGRAYPYQYRPFAYYDVPFYGNWYGLYRTYPPLYYDRPPADYGFRYAPRLPDDFILQPRLPQPRPVDDTASIRVLVPRPDAQVWFDDTLMKQKGAERLYSSPPLEPGGNYSYKIRATWTENGREVTRERTVPLTRGEEVVVDFTDEPIP